MDKLNEYTITKYFENVVTSLEMGIMLLFRVNAITKRIAQITVK